MGNCSYLPAQLITQIVFQIVQVPVVYLVQQLTELSDQTSFIPKLIACLGISLLLKFVKSRQVILIMTLVLHVAAIVLLSVKYGYLTSNACYFSERLMYSKYASYYLVFFSSWNQFWTLYYTVKHEGLGIRLAVLRFLIQ